MPFRAESVSARPWGTLYRVPPICLGVCLVTVHDGSAYREEVLLALPAFVGRELTSYREIGPGSRLVAELVPLREAPRELLTFQKSDDINRFDLPIYVSTRLLAITKPLADSAIPTLGLSTRLPSEEVPTSPPTRTTLRQDKIAERREGERERIAGMLATCGGSWEAWYVAGAECRRRHLGQTMETGGVSYLWGSHYYDPALELGYEKTAALVGAAPSVTTLIALHETLAARGIHLIAVPVPLRDEVSALRAFPGDKPPFDVLSPERLRLFDHLLAAGVDVVDVLPTLADLPEEKLAYFDAADHHLAPDGVVAVAGLLAGILESYGLPRASAPFPRESRTFRMPAFTHEGTFPRDAIYSALTLTQPSAVLTEDPALLLIGDSQVTVPNQYHHSNANLHDHLSWELGRRTGLISFPGGSPKVFQHLSQNVQRLGKTSVVVFVFDPSFLTSRGQWWPEPGEGGVYRVLELGN